MSDQSQDGKFENWAIVEIMGHNVIAGFVTEVAKFGVAMMRVDVPDLEVNGIVKPGFTKFYGGSSIYAITPTTQEIALEAAKRLDVRPVSLWVVPDPRPALPSGRLADDPDALPDDHQEDYAEYETTGRIPF
jgi:hypothetical protein